MQTTAQHPYILWSKALFKRLFFLQLKTHHDKACTAPQSSHGQSHFHDFRTQQKEMLKIQEIYNPPTKPQGSAIDNIFSNHLKSPEWNTFPTKSQRKTADLFEAQIGLCHERRVLLHTS